MVSPHSGASARSWYPGHGLLRIRLPNFEWRKRVIAHHDAHHLLTGYPCTPAGEMQMTAWEFAAGRFPHAGATALPLVGMGAVLLPRRTFWRSCVDDVAAQRDPYKVNPLILGPSVNPVHGTVR